MFTKLHRILYFVQVVTDIDMYCIVNACLDNFGVKGDRKHAMPVRFEHWYWARRNNRLSSRYSSKLHIYNECNVQQAAAYTDFDFG